ncbi:glycosyltransferase [Pedobacter sp. Hv1]|uniref:glycosyltransferase n=1 Tax=Pedobacter sp. Hv1 TaxID=1740090 RepID=UPI0013791C2B|nr:glycosyltransferase [Pedobacter sp. Hv1]
MKDKFGSYATFSDWFRIGLLFKHGGWWVDMDTICLQAFDFEEEYVFSSELAGTAEKIANAPIKCPKNSAFMKECLGVIKQKDLSKIEWGEVGARLLQQHIEKYNFWHFIADPNMFNPIPYDHFSLLFTNVNIDFSEETHAVHFWNEMLRRNSIDTNLNFHQKSFFERVKLKYLKP